MFSSDFEGNDLGGSSANSSFVDPDLRDKQKTVARKTLDALITRKHLSFDEAEQIQSAYLSELDGMASVEVFETIVRLSTTSPRDIPQFIRQLGDAVSKTLERNVPYVPLAGRLQKPSAFYERHDSVKPLCKALLTPILYAEESEVIGIGSINPKAAFVASELVANAVSATEPVKPFMSVVRVDYDTWKTLLEKQFGL
ncbi:hypothetical protein [Sulfuriroseicoccus oceanibius]|uniref:Uncharacterized protein n=1 Tax=Sulfuriroseicoccus oceanibius TaxID=2707525 RepID=A0A6B3LAL9_9BACT|nr:hypothetical protein [Sulfuriroseicoccus oceanibius]QQL44485.1 hypothetical protein G3M56_011425 [Sulfuriroseicoccus oceanibius]